MPRHARIVIPGVPHHITQRGNDRQQVFYSDEDYSAYLSMLRKQSDKYGLDILAWCLMPNHIHLIARPHQQDSLAKTIGRTHLHYAQHFNDTHHRTGHLWQNRFFSCPLGRNHFWRAVRYVEQNPTRAKITDQPWQHKWSSAAAHLTGRDTMGLLNMPWWKNLSARIDWRRALQIPQSPATLEQIRTSTNTGRPLADNSFLTALETHLNRPLRPRSPGRPKK